jgi:peptide/nickel transport system ATP-binding protein
MAFACRPSLIVLDEPTTGLDVTTQVHVLDTIRTLCAASHVAAVYVSHDLAVVGEVANRVGVMYAGQLVEDGPSDDIFRAPAHPYTQGLLRAIPSPTTARRLVGIDGSPPAPGSLPAGCAFASRCDVSQPDCAEHPPPRTVLPGSDHVVVCVRPGHARPAGVSGSQPRGFGRLVRKCRRPMRR